MGRRNNNATIATETRTRRSHQRIVSGQILPANKLVNVRRRAERAMGGIHAPFVESIVTCPASRHLMMMADALAAKRKYHMFDEDPEHCAAGMYAVLESLWKARTKIKRLTANDQAQARRASDLSKPETFMSKPKTPNRVRSSEIVVLQRLLGLIDIRRRTMQRELKDAIENKQWSKVSGWDGIDIGLMMAEKTIKEEMQHNAPGEPPPGKRSNDGTEAL